MKKIESYESSDGEIHKSALEAASHELVCVVAERGWSLKDHVATEFLVVRSDIREIFDWLDAMEAAEKEAGK